MGMYVKNEDGSYVLRFGKDRSSGFGAGAITVPIGAYQARVVSDAEAKGRSEGPEGAATSRIVRCEIMDPEELDGVLTAGQVVPVYLPTPEDKSDGSDKAVHFLWEGYMAALGVNTSELGEDQEIEVNPDKESVGTAIEIEVYDDSYKGKVRRKARIVGPAQLAEGAAAEAGPEAEPEAEQPRALPPQPRTAARSGNNAQAAAATAKAPTRAPAKPAARTAAAPPRRR